MQDLFITPTQFDEFDDAGKELYAKEADGKGYMFRLNINREGWGIEDVAGLKSALNTKKGDLQKATTALDRFEDLDPTQAKKDRELVLEFDNKDWTKDEKVKAQIASRELSLKTKYDQDVAKLTEVNGSLTSQLHKHLGTASAVSAITKHKGNLTLLLPHVRALTKVELNQDTGEFVSRVINPDGSLRVSLQTGNSGLMDHNELVGLLATQDEFLPAFEGSGQSGSGAHHSDSRAGRVAGGDKKYFLSLADQGDHGKYKAMKEQAEKAGQELTLEQRPIIPSVGT